MINCNKNENYNWKIDHINKVSIDLDLSMETNIQNIACLCKAMSYVIINT